MLLNSLYDSSFVVINLHYHLQVYQLQFLVFGNDQIVMLCSFTEIDVSCGIYVWICNFSDTMIETWKKERINQCMLIFLLFYYD